MEKSLPYIILEVYPLAINGSEDPVMAEAYRRAFDWANRMGLEENRKVCALRFVKSYNERGAHSWPM
jgi:hypothetical protein